MLIGPSTYRRVNEIIDVGESIRVEMKGVPDPTTLYEVRAMRGPYNLRLKERQETLIPLEAILPVHIYRLKDKIITSRGAAAEITQLCDTAAVVRFTGDLVAWEDVRLNFLDAEQNEIPGKIYGKVTAVEPGEGDFRVAHISFTSVSPEIRAKIKEALGA